MKIYNSTLQSNITIEVKKKTGEANSVENADV